LFFSPQCQRQESESCLNNSSPEESLAEELDASCCDMDNLSDTE
jgi:hypothetical protein